MKKQNVEFRVRKGTLRGTLFTPIGKGPFPGVISFHGSGGKGEKYYEWGEEFAASGIMTFVFNFTGCGRSDGDFQKQTYKDALIDAKEAFKFFLNQPNVNHERVGLIGGSFGGFVAAMVLPNIKVKSLVLLAPSAHADKLSSKIYRGDLGEEVKYFLNKDNWLGSPSYDNIEKFNEQLLIIKSENDENVPADVVDRYFKKAENASEKELKVIKGADHRLSTQDLKDTAFKLINDWFLQTL